MQNTKSKISLSIFFPAFNEEANIADSVKAADEAVKKITDTYEIIIVNDGSSDQTGEIADKLAAENEHISVVHHNPNRGYGAALWSGIQAAKYDYIFFTDADLQFDLHELAILAHYVPEYKVVLGYRSPRRDPLLRLVFAKGWNFLNRLLFGLKVKDIDCAFKLMDRRLVASLPLITRGAMMSAEMLIRLQLKHVTFKEVPVSHYPRLEGTPTGANPKVIMRAFREIWRLYRGQLGSVSRQQLGRFALIGVVNTLIDIGIYYILTRFTGFFADHLLIAKGTSFICGTIFSFFANRIFTFQKKSPFRVGELARFYLTVGMGIVINVASHSFFLDVVRVPDLVSVVLATIVTFIWNFTASKLWVYSEADPRKLHPRLRAEAESSAKTTPSGGVAYSSNLGSTTVGSDGSSGENTPLA